MNFFLIVIWIISLVPLFLIPYSIAVFYQRSFRRKTYPFLFIVSLLLLVASFPGYINQSFSYGMLFFAIGGILLGGASLRLDQVMTGREK
jgi:drug/metabolite transporter (DMT)-like permease